MHEADANPLNLLSLQQEIHDRLTEIQKNRKQPLEINMLDAERKPKTRKGRQNSRGTDHNYLTGKVDHEGTHPVLNQKMQVLKSPNIHLPDDRTEKCIVHTVVNKSCREPFFTTETERLTQLRKIIADLNKPNRPKTLESNVSLVPQVTNKTMTAQATQTG